MASMLQSPFKIPRLPVTVPSVGKAEKDVTKFYLRLVQKTGEMAVDATGGGVVVSGSHVTLINATVALNRSTAGRGGDGGDGVINDGGNGGNAGDSSGGGIDIRTFDSSVDVSNVTINANLTNSSAVGAGGVAGSAGLAGTAGVLGAQQGGGVFIEGPMFSSSGGVLDASDTIIANNVSLTGPDVHGAFNTASSVLLENPTDATGITDGVAGNILNQDPLLGPLTAVGILLYYPLTPNSPAVDAALGGEATDQIGQPRPSGNTFDIGAHELQLDSVFIVNTTDDTNDANLSDGIAMDANGNVSLRAAIEQANFSPSANGIDLIRFDIPGAGTHKILVGSNLPAINSHTFIDGASEPGYVGQPVIEIDGANVASLGLRFMSSNSSAKGLSIINFTAIGVDLVYEDGVAVTDNFIGVDTEGRAAGNKTGVRALFTGSHTITNNVISGNSLDGVHINAIQDGGNIVSGNMIGTNPAGNAEIPNGRDGLLLNTPNSVVSNNVISGNDRWGMLVLGGGVGNDILGNKIGTDTAGLVAIPNIGGVILAGSNNNLGGVGEGNTISGNDGQGVFVFGNNVSGNQLLGNKIGVNEAGTASLPNGSFGVQVTNGDSNQIGGMLPGEGNIISGNALDGVFVQGNAFSNEVVGNKIGTDALGTSAIPNQRDGVRLSNGAKLASVSHNQISGNVRRGVAVTDIFSTDNVIASNFIGTDASGTMPLLNGVGGGVSLIGPNNTVTSNTITAPDFGVAAFNHATGSLVASNWIGTDSSETSTTLGMQTGILISTGADGSVVESNVIANNDKAVVVSGSATSVRVSENSIFDNQVIGIDLGGDGLTTNDVFDVDEGANRLQNSPVISRARTINNARIVIDYVVDTGPSVSTYPLTLEFFVSDGSGQGKTFLGSAVYTSAQARTVQSVSIAGVSVPVGAKVVATATDLLGNTSEFGDEFTVS